MSIYYTKQSRRLNELASYACHKLTHIEMCFIECDEASRTIKLSLTTLKLHLRARTKHMRVVQAPSILQNSCSVPPCAVPPMISYLKLVLSLPCWFKCAYWWWWYDEEWNVYLVLLKTKVANVVWCYPPLLRCSMLVDSRKFLELLKDKFEMWWCCPVQCFFCYKQPISYRTPILRRRIWGEVWVFVSWEENSKNAVGMQSIVNWYGVEVKWLIN